MRHYLFLAAILLALPTRVEALPTPAEAPDSLKPYEADLRGVFPLDGKSAAALAAEHATGILTAIVAHPALGTSADPLNVSQDSLVPTSSLPPQTDTKTRPEKGAPSAPKALVAIFTTPPLGEKQLGKAVYSGKLSDELRRIALTERGIDVLVENSGQGLHDKRWLKTKRKQQGKPKGPFPGQVLHVELSPEHDVRTKSATRFEAFESYKGGATKVFAWLEDAPQQVTVLSKLKNWATSRFIRVKSRIERLVGGGKKR